MFEANRRPLALNSICVDLCHVMTSPQSARESSEVQDELSEKVDRLKAELVVFKSLMSDVSISLQCCHQHFLFLLHQIPNKTHKQLLK